MPRQSPGKFYLWMWLLSLAVIAPVGIFVVCVLPETQVRQVGQDPIIGLTSAQMISRYGQPDHRDPPYQGSELWIYFRGNMGGGTGVVFKNDVVVSAEMRSAR